MLQQTQVATVVPYFERWLLRFPTLAALAVAPLDDVLKGWEGLGYYARARNLHRAAQTIVKEHGGQMPGDKKTLLALPGIGQYTAGAILSLAFGLREPVLDGNVRRVLCRLYDIAGVPQETATEKQLWEFARALVWAAPDGAAGALNESLMELGALTCTPAAPDCTACPLAALCRAHASGNERERPVKRPTPRTPHFDTTAAVIQEAQGRFLLVQRPTDGLLGGLWGFPGGTVQADEAPETGVIRTLCEQIGVEVMPEASLGQIQHAYTHFRITLHVFRCRLMAGEPRPLGCADVRWVAAEQIGGYAFPSTDQKIIAALHLNTPAAPVPHLETTP